MNVELSPSSALIFWNPGYANDTCMYWNIHLLRLDGCICTSGQQETPSFVNNFGIGVSRLSAFIIGNAFLHSSAIINAGAVLSQSRSRYHLLESSRPLGCRSTPTGVWRRYFCPDTGSLTTCSTIDRWWLSYRSWKLLGLWLYYVMCVESYTVERRGTGKGETDGRTDRQRRRCYHAGVCKIVSHIFRLEPSQHDRMKVQCESSPKWNKFGSMLKLSLIRVTVRPS